MKETRLLKDEELSLYSLEHIFCMCSIFYEQGMSDIITTFDLYIRDLPPHRNFLIAGGLEAIVDYLTNLKFTEDQVQYLLDSDRISENFANYLRNFSFSGTVYALPEGTVHFPGEILVRVTAPIIEANLITDALMSLAVIDTMLLTKLARVRMAAKDKRLGMGFVRAQGIDAGWRTARNAYMFENMGMSNAACTKRLGQKSLSVIVAHHAFIKSFSDELTAMRQLAGRFPNSASVMIDTYDIKQGIANAMTVAKELKVKGQTLGGIVIDSGDVLEIARYARKTMDEAGFPEIKITIAGNLDEYKISHLMDENVPVDTFLVVTDVITSADAPKLEMVYKMAQMEDRGEIRYTAKFSTGKISLPGIKQIYRKLENGKISEDIIGLEDENLGEALLVEIIKHGKLVYKMPSMEESRSYITKQLELLPESYKDIFNESSPPTKISEKATSLLEHVRQKHNAA